MAPSPEFGRSCLCGAIVDSGDIYCSIACARTDSLSSLCFRDPSLAPPPVTSRHSEPSLSAIMEHPGSPSSSQTTPLGDDRFEDAPFDFTQLNQQCTSNGRYFLPSHTPSASLHEAASHPYAHANVEWSASHYRRQALEEIKRDERRRRRRTGSVGRVPDLIGGAGAHDRNESWASTISSSASSVMTIPGSAGRNAMTGMAVEVFDGIREEEEVLSNTPGSFDIDAFSPESYSKQGVLGSSGPKRFKLGLRNRSTSEGTGLSAVSQEGDVLGMPTGPISNKTKRRHPSFVLREVSAGAPPIGTDMKDVLDEIIRMEKGFTVHSDSDRETSEEERDPLYGRTSVRGSLSESSSEEADQITSQPCIPATPRAGVQRARQLNQVVPPAPLRQSISYPGMLDTPLPLEPEDSAQLDTPYQPGHLPSRSLNSLLLPPKDYPEGNWQLSPGSGHPTKVRSRPTSVSISGNQHHKHLRSLSSGCDAMDEVMNPSRPVSEIESRKLAEKRMSKRSSYRTSRELSPDSQARGHRIRRSLTFENTSAGPRFPNGVILGSDLPKPDSGLKLSTPPTGSFSMSSSRRPRARKALDDSVTRFQFPLSVRTNLAAVERGEIDVCCLNTPIKIKVDEPSYTEELAFRPSLETVEAMDVHTPTQGFFEAQQSYLTPHTRTSSGATIKQGGLLEPSLLPSTPVSNEQTLPVRTISPQDHDMEY